MAGFTKGNKIGRGRPKGSVNKVTKKTKDMMKLVLDNNMKKLQADLNKMDPKDRWNILMKLSDKIVPSLKAVDQTTTITAESSLGFNISYTEDTKDGE